MSYSTDEIGKGLKALAHEQEGCIENVRTLIEDLNSSQTKVEKNAVNAISSSELSLKLVKEGIGSIDNLLQKVNQLNAAVKTSDKNIEQLEELSNMIAGFAGVIAGISNKTNMLSLNASIEAARAGEHGRGFAVVASQVRSLAAQSAESSTQIANTIKSIQTFVKEMVDDMSVIFRVVEEQNEMISSVGSVLEKILDAAHKSNNLSHDMEKEITYQSGVMDQTKETMDTIADILVQASIYTNKI